MRHETVSSCNAFATATFSVCHSFSSTSINLVRRLVAVEIPKSGTVYLVTRFAIALSKKYCYKADLHGIGNRSTIM